MHRYGKFAQHIHVRNFNLQRLAGGLLQNIALCGRNFQYPR